MFWSRAVAVVLLLGVAGCGSIPLPFKKSARGGGANSLITLRDAPGIRIDPIEGSSIPMAKLLARAVADALGANNIPASDKPFPGAGYILKGRIEKAVADPNDPYLYVLHWRLLTSSGKEVGAYSQKIRGDKWQWEYGDPRIIRSVGIETARPIAALIQDKDENLRPAQVPLISVVVEKVDGAPGDGNAALTRAMKVALRGADVLVTDDLRQAGYVLQGRVRVSPPAGGAQAIRIKWKVMTLDGAEAGLATQENAVPEGSLDGKWGGMATNVARAAVGGIKAIIEGVRIVKAPKRLRPPPSPRLPRIPGRAPPPPR